MPLCPTCNAPVEGDAQFCPRDGTPLQGAASADPLVGRMLSGRYRLTERLGAGGMGAVYRAMHTLMDKPVAVKVLRADLAGDPEAVARFHREARSASRLDHEHCIRVTDFGQSEDGLLFLVMELLEGEPLSALLARGRLSTANACTLAVSIAQALEHAHEHGVIHRDLKPDNVFLVNRRGRQSVKVLDFGLAKIAGDGTNSKSITQAGVVFGTPEYMPPEQAQGMALDARTDLYSFGVMLYQMLTGDLPFKAPSFLALLTKQVQEPPEPPRQRCPEADIPEALEQLVLRLMSKHPDGRPSSAAAVAEALAPWAEATPSGLSIPVDAAALGGRTPSGAAFAPTHSLTPVAQPEPSSSPSLLHGELMPARRFGRNVALSLVGVGIVVAGVLGYVAMRPHPTPDTPIAATDKKAQPADPMAEARRLLDADDLDGAERILVRERAARDGMDLQFMLSDLKLKRGNRIGALAHLVVATRRWPEQAETHARLASLLALYGQNERACKEAKLALARDAKSSTAKSAARAAGCKGIAQ